MILCIKYPNDEYDPNLNCFKLSLAHSLEVGILNCFFTLELPLYTCIGVIEIMSIYGYSIDKPSESILLKAFDELYKVIYGIGLNPAKEDKLTIADLHFLYFIFFIRRAFKQPIVTQLTLIKSTTSLYSAFS